MATAAQPQGARKCASVTPSDTINLPIAYPMFITVNGSGDIAFVGSDDVVNVVTVAVGVANPISPKRINSTGTTATGIRAWYPG